MRSVPQRRRSSVSDPERAKIRERNCVAAKKCRQKKKRENEQIEHRLSDEIQMKEILLAQLNCLREEARSLKNMIFQHAGCENQQIDLQLARMTRNVLISTSKCAQPVHEATPTPVLSYGVWSVDSADSESQPNAINTDSNNESDWTLFPKVSDDFVTPTLGFYPGSMFDNIFLDVADA